MENGYLTRTRKVAVYIVAGLISLVSATTPPGCNGDKYNTLSSKNNGVEKVEAPQESPRESGESLLGGVGQDVFNSLFGSRKSEPEKD